MSRAQYEASLKGLEESRAVALAALELDSEAKGACEEVIAYSKLIGDAKTALANLPPEPPKLPTGVIGVVVRSSSPRRHGPPVVVWYDFSTQLWSLDEPPHGPQHDVAAARLCGESYDMLSGEVDAPIHTAINVVAAGKLFSIGGNPYEYPHDEIPDNCMDVQILNPVTWRWERFADGPLDGAVTCVAAMNNHIYAVGEIDQDSGAIYDGNMYVMDLATKKWAHFPVPIEPSQMRRVNDAIITGNSWQLGIIVAGENTWTALPPIDCAPCAHIGQFQYYYARAND